MDKINLLLVEDDPIWMDGITNQLHKENDLKVVAQASSKEDALKLDCINIDVAILDISLSDDEEFSGFEVAKHLKTQGLEKIIMLTSWEDPAIILESFDNGAMNFIKKSSYKDLPNIVRDTFYGRINLQSDIAGLILNELKIERKTSVLTPAEKEVYRLKEAGYTRGQIAEKLYKSVETIKKQLQTIKKKIK